MEKPKNPLTIEGFRELKKERDHLLRVVRPEVVGKIADAAAEGDRSENAEYIYGKKRLRELDRRLKYLSLLLSNVLLVNSNELTGKTVCLGATVGVLTEEGVRKKWIIVGEGEAGFRKESISYKSPVARALIGKCVGDIVEVELPSKRSEYEITHLWFGEELIDKVDS